jgi:hypothetical protein
MVMMWIKCFDFSLRGDATPGREKEGDGASWDDINFTGLKNKKIHAVDSVATSGR